MGKKKDQIDKILIPHAEPEMLNDAKFMDKTMDSLSLLADYWLGETTSALDYDVFKLIVRRLGSTINYFKAKHETTMFTEDFVVLARKRLLDLMKDKTIKQNDLNRHKLMFIQLQLKVVRQRMSNNEREIIFLSDLFDIASDAEVLYGAKSETETTSTLDLPGNRPLLGRYGYIECDVCSEVMCKQHFKKTMQYVFDDLAECSMYFLY
ncbi:hypothetical protein HDE_02147 [Halotydeus destructor]|nr:hypothetical protein HDE_02147 [Halotydeus destructor]